MKKLIGWLCLVAVAAASYASAPAVAQTYPDRPVKILVGYAAGGATDAIARITAQKLSEVSGQQFIVENRPGAGGNLAADQLAKSKPDGYTLIVVAPAHAINASLYKNLGYDALRDFQPISLLATITNVLVTHPSVPVKSVPELLDYAKRNPDKLNYASAGIGASSHIAAELFKSMTGTRLTHVPYRGTGQSVTDLLSGNVQLTFDSMPALLPHIQSGKLVALGVGSAKRSPALPDVPTIAESGVAGYEISVWIGMLAPAGTPTKIVSYLNNEIRRAMRDEAVVQRVRQTGSEPDTSTPEEFGRHLAVEIEKYKKVIETAGIKAE